MNFAAVILAGGKSSRMGRDKAWLEFAGQSLLARQIALARELGAGETFVSGRPGVDYAALGCPVLHDPVPDCGPLSGIAAALAATRPPLLLVLAVDMPYLDVEFLKRLYAHGRDGLGAVPKLGEIIEPLAAFYPKAAESLMRPLLATLPPDHPPGAKRFAQRCVAAGLARFVALSPAEAGRFQSWNSPGDLPGGPKTMETSGPREPAEKL